MSTLQYETFSDREIEVLQALADGLEDGLTNREIGDKLFISNESVKWYIRTFNQKLDTSSKEEIVARARELGLLDPARPKSQQSKHNLPFATTPFVGREDELQQIRDLLADDRVRLLTLLAPGGMGKTRLALEAAEQQLSTFKSGVYFVNLAALNDPNNIPGHIATATGYQFSGDQRSPKQQILDYLSNKHMLLVLDNYEHLLEGAALVSEILQAAKDVKVLVTSREKLQLSGETVFSLGGMHFPDWESPEDALDYDAVQLLLQAAQRAKPDWQLTADNLDSVSRICKLTAGMPLAILLAMSWLDLLSIEEIATEIQSSLDFLSSENRDMPQRQHSVRAVFDYTWRRLNPAEQTAFMKMSVFRGGFTRKAAEHVTGANLRALQSLVNKALLTHGRNDRFQIHELLRQYAEIELEAAGLADETRDAHMHYYANAMHEREEHLKDHRQVEALDDIEADFENIRAAWMWGVERDACDALYMMITSLTLFFSLRGSRRAVNALFEYALEHLPHTVDSRNHRVRACIHVGLAFGKLGLGTPDLYPTLTQCLEILEEHGQPTDIANCKRTIAQSLADIGRFREARATGLEALSMFEALEDNFGMAYTCIILGYLYAQDPSLFEEAITFTRRAYELHSRQQNYSGTATCLHNLSEMTEPPDDDFLRYTNEALELRRRVGNKFGIIISLMTLSQFNILHNQLDIAQSLIDEAAALADELQEPSSLQDVGWGRTMLTDMRGNAHHALQLANEALTFAIQGANWSNILKVCLQQIWLFVQNEQFEQALSTLVPVLAEHRENTVAYRHPGLYGAFVLLFIHLNEPERAVAMLGLMSVLPQPKLYLAHHPRLIALQVELRETLGDAAYEQAWQQGTQLDRHVVLRELLEEFGT